MIKAGFFEVDICPSVLMSNTSFDEAPISAIASPPKLTASVWQAGDRKVALAGADIVSFPRPLWERARTILAERFGIPTLLCAASHAHSAGPAIKDWVLPREAVMAMADIKPELRDWLYHVHLKPGEAPPVPESVNQLYLDLLVCRLVDAVVCADQRLEEVSLAAGRDVVRDVGHSRRQRLKQGWTVSHAGKGNPDIVGDAGPLDEDVVALGAVNRHGRVTGVLVNYACHATVAGVKDGISGDWPFHLRETLKQLVDPGTVTVVLNGCCGDVTQVDNISLEPLRSGERWAKILGRRVAFPVADILAREPAHAFDVLNVATRDLPLDWRPIPEALYRQAVDLVNTQRGGVEGCWFPKGVVLHKRKAELMPHALCQLNVLQIGNLVIATTPAETFAATGLEIKRASPFPWTMTVELVNDWLGYMPTAEAFGPRGGGYEPLLKQGTCLEVDAARKVAEALGAMIRQFRPEREIPPPRVAKAARTGVHPFHSRPEAP